jgi:hypothetical protein
MNRPLLQPTLPDGATLKIIGLGGVGGIVARYLSVFLASLDRDARLVLIDGDDFEHSNHTRMLFGSYGNKAVVTQNELAPRFAESSLSIIAVEEYVTRENISRLIQSGDIVLLTVDNHATRKLVSDHCGTLPEVCLLSGGNDGVEKDASGQMRRGTYGNVQIYLRRGGADASPSLTRYHAEITQPADKLPTDKSCTDLIVSVPQILFANLTVATCLLNTLWLYLCDALHYSELAFDIADGLMRPAALPPPK